jgi:HEAT repeat protein
VRQFNRISLQLLALIARVRPDERRDVLGAFLTLLGFMTGHALLETARDALFLASLPARRLPWAYLAIAVIALGLGQREPRVVRRISARSELGRWLLVAGVVTGAFWLVVGSGEPWVLYGLYAWSGVLASLVVVRFWTVLGSRFTVTQAKRVFPVIASGSVAGAILGSGLARILTESLDPRHLVLAAGAAFLVASTAPAVIAGQEPSLSRRPHWADLGAVTRSIWGGPYLRRVAALVLFATVTFTLVDFVFKSAADRYVSPDDLGEFFASVYLSFNVLSLVVQVLGVALLLRLVGLVSAVSVVPAVLLISTLGFAVGGGLTLALVLKGADGTLRHSLYRTGTELLFVPLSDRLRTQVKGVIDVLGQRGGQALAAILILMLLSTTANLAVFAALACVTAAAWLVVAVSLREPYLDLFRQTLHAESAPRGTGFPALDMASLETLMATLNTPDDRRVIAALDILEEQGKVAVVPAPLLYHPSPAVVVRSLDLFTAAARDDALLMVSRLLEHTDPGVRAASVRSLSALDPNRSVFEKALLDEDLLVAASARAALVACGWEEGRELALQLRDIVTRGDRAVQQATARALRVRPSPQLEDVVLALLGTEDPEVLSEAITAARVLRTPALVEPLIGLLARRAVREEARAALAGFGPLALERLGAALQSGDLSHGVRRHVPGAIALVGSARAPEILLRHLENEPDGMIRFKVLRALGRWRREQPSFPLDVTLLQGALGYAVSTGFRLMGWRRGLMTAGDVDPTLRTELHDVLVALLRDKQDNALERVFRLLNLQSGSEEFQRVYRGLHSPHAASRAGSRELLHHMVLPPVRKPLLTLVDDLHGEADETSDLPEGGQELSVAYAGVLGEIVECGMESASSLAAAHAVELELVSVRGSLTSVQPLSADHRRTLVSAIRHLARGSA